MSASKLCSWLKSWAPEIILSIFLGSIWFYGWLAVEPKYLCPDQRPESHFVSHDERELSLIALQGAVNGTLTATSILLAGCAAFLGLYHESKNLPGNVKIHFSAAALFGMISIILGAVSLAYIPPAVNIFNVSTLLLINALSFFQLLSMVFCAIRLFRAIKELFS